jgi:hypothetical protein
MGPTGLVEWIEVVDELDRLVMESIQELEVVTVELTGICGTVLDKVVIELDMLVASLELAERSNVMLDEDRLKLLLLKVRRLQNELGEFERYVVIEVVAELLDTMVEEEYSRSALEFDCPLDVGHVVIEGAEDALDCSELEKLELSGKLDRLDEPGPKPLVRKFDVIDDSEFVVLTAFEIEV